MNTFFCRIDEKKFAHLYCENNGSPNKPVNILLSLEFIKHLYDYTDEQLLEQYYFNYQIAYALGQRNLGELYICERTLYDFRRRLYEYTIQHPEEEDPLRLMAVTRLQLGIPWAGSMVALAAAMAKFRKNCSLLKIKSTIRTRSASPRRTSARCFIMVRANSREAAILR